MRLVDADALEKEGWSLHRTVRVDRHTSEYQVKPIAKVPTIEPERKTGRWVSVGCVVPDIANVLMIKCTVCGHLEPDVDVARTPYCSHCGAYMKGGDDD